MKISNLIKCLLFICLWIVVVVSGCSKSENPSSVKSTEKKITALGFTITGMKITAVIIDSTITATMPNGTNITALSPSITISSKATISPLPGQSQDFSKNVIYTVKAEDGSTQTYTVTVNNGSAPPPLVIDCNNIPSVLEDRSNGIDYIISCAITLTSTKSLTIKPGVRIQFDGETAGISVTSDKTALKMVGTAANPIILEGKTASPGSWTGIQLNSNNTENQWEYVTMQHAGAGINAAALFISDNAYFLHNSKISIKYCTFKDNKGYGIRDQDNGYNYDRIIFSSFSSNNFSNNTNAPLCLTIDDIGSLDSQSNYGTNGQNYIEVHGKQGLTSNVLVQKLSIPYYIFESIGLYQKMTLSTGVTLQFYTDAGFNLDKQYIGKGTIIANGTAANPIRLVGYKAGKGVWLGLSLWNNDPEISLSYCNIDGAGSNLHSNYGCISNVKAAINFGSCDYTAKPVVTNCIITNSGGYGIVHKKMAIVNFSNNSYSGNTLANEFAF